jgi:hypothetical protein
LDNAVAVVELTQLALDYKHVNIDESVVASFQTKTTQICTYLCMTTKPVRVFIQTYPYDKPALQSGRVGLLSNTPGDRESDDFLGDPSYSQSL